MKTSLRHFTVAIPLVLALAGFGASALIGPGEDEALPAYVLVAEEDDSNEEESSDEDEESDEESDDEQSDEDENENEATYVPPAVPTTPSPTPTPTATPSPKPTPAATQTTEAPVVSTDKTVLTSAESTLGGLDASQLIVFGFLGLVAVAAVVDAIRRRSLPAVVPGAVVPGAVVQERVEPEA